MAIVANDGVLHGLPRIEGTRISVVHVYDMVVGGAEPAEAADSLDVELGRIYEALAYYYDHPDEMRDVREREEAVLDDLRRRTIDPPVETRDAR